MESAVNWTRKLTKLKMLSFEGNPLILGPNYQKIMVERMPNIKVLDSITIPLDQRKAAEAAAQERASRIGSASNAECPTPIAAKISLDISFRVLKNVEGGRYLIPDENCTIENEKLDEMEDEKKCSMYWMSYVDHNGHLIVTEKKSYIKHF